MLARCSSCSTGAAHAGRGKITYAKWFRAAICPRCGVGTTRMIYNRRCVGCYNRQREMQAGRNARGNVPRELLRRPLRTVEVMLDVDGEVHCLRDRDSSGMAETVVQVLRTTTGMISFAFAGAGVQPHEGAPTAEIQGEGVIGSEDQLEAVQAAESGQDGDVGDQASVEVAASAMVEPDATSGALSGDSALVATAEPVTAPRRPASAFARRLMASTVYTGVKLLLAA
jgi:hypothetical protein